MRYDQPNYSPSFRNLTILSKGPHVVSRRGWWGPGTPKWPPDMKLEELYKFLRLFILLIALLAAPSKEEAKSPRVVTTKYGKLRGSIRPLPNKNLRPVEVFLGIPYANPPIGSNRFSPTRSPNSWSGERIASQYGSVCPQRFPDIWDENATDKMPLLYLQHLKKLHNYLSNQAEDCLYLNIYVPSLVADTVGHKALPVVVFIHGDSFEWGASNPYDGSVMAAYGEVIVVTLNYRLGPLGFLNTNVDPGSRGHVMNHGLMDQIAALHWIQECIGAFGGDPGSVTLLGHGTGAACIQFLMVSAAVVPGLFHRAILMSGSALSSWATVDTPAHYALQLGYALNCTGPLPSGLSLHDPEQIPSSDELDNMVNCLKEKPLDELNAVQIEAPRFLYAFGPSVDGIVIKSDYKSELHRHGEEVNKEYDLLFGVVPLEAYNDLSEKDAKLGFNSEFRDKIFRTLVRNIYDYHLNEVFISVVNEYTHWDRPNPFPIEIRDTTLDALGDARFVAPLVRTSKNLRIGEKNQFFYVFNHSSKNSEKSVTNGAIHGSELPYVFGAPLVQELGVFSGNWTEDDQLMSEAMLSYLTNFAKTGSPNFVNEQDIFSKSRKKLDFLNLRWEKYDSVYQKYLYLDTMPQMMDHYRANQLALWTWLIPQLQRVGRLEFLTLRDPGKSAANKEVNDHLQELSVLHHLFTEHDDPELYAGNVRLLYHMAGHYIIPPSTTAIVPSTSMFTNVLTTNDATQMHDPPVVHLNASILAEATKPQNAVDYVSYSTALSVTIAIGVSLLVLNVLIFAGVYYQRDRSRLENKHEQQSQQTSRSSSEDHMASITGASGPLLCSSGTLDLTKTSLLLSSIKEPSSSPVSQSQEFLHISECPPAFADAPVVTSSYCSTNISAVGGVISGSSHFKGLRPLMPNGSATQITNCGDILPYPPPPPRLISSESQPLLPVSVPSPPRAKVPPYDDLRV